MKNNRTIGSICSKHPDLKGERFKHNGTCPACSNEHSKRCNQKVRDRAKLCEELQDEAVTSKLRIARLERALGAMLFLFDDGVGRSWSADALDYARKLTPAVEFKPVGLPREDKS